MFPGGGSPNMQEMLKQAQQLQEQLAAAQDELARTEVEGSAGGGLVTATVTGAGELTALEIRPEAYDADDPDAMTTIADLVLAAVRDATANAGELQSRALGPVTQGLGGAGLGLPGM